MGVNLCVIEGNLTRDPELRYTQSGKAVVQITIANNEKRGDKEVVTFVDVTFWERTAEIVAEFLAKGSRIIVEGSLEQDNWQDKNSGEKRSKLRIQGRRMHMIGKPAEKSGEPASDDKEPSEPEGGGDDGDADNDGIPF